MTRRKMRSTLAEYRPVTLHEVAQPLGAPTAPTGAPAGAGARGPSGAPPSPPCDGCCTPVAHPYNCHAPPSGKSSAEASHGCKTRPHKPELERALPVAKDFRVIAHDAFPGSAGFAVEYVSAPDAIPVWPMLRTGFLGSASGDSGERLLRIAMPAGPRGRLVFDGAGQFIGLALPRVSGHGGRPAGCRVATEQGARFSPGFRASDDRPDAAGTGR